ncbi:MAG TPA: DoxX family protein [Blastocatellia bacterium]|nr:DoxX family protein [Blastocatellia bacterium]
MGKVKTFILWVLQVLFALFYTIQGIAKFNSSSWIDRFRSYGYPDHFYLVIGVLEVLGGVSLLIPKMTGYGAALLAVIMGGACLTHLAHHETPNAIATAVFMILLGLLAYGRRRVWIRSRQEPQNL